MSKCKHDKAFSSMVLMSNPPQYPWICRKCGQEGRDRGTLIENDYPEIKEKFNKQKQ